MHLRQIALIAPMLATAACTSDSSQTETTSALTGALQASMTASGMLGCAPTADQLAACTGAAAGDACTLAVNSTSLAGTCRASITGEVGCAPNPPAPPEEAVAACSGLAAGDACTVVRPDGDEHAGACSLAPDGTTLACHHVFTPPQAAIDACASLASGDACTMTGREGEVRTGSCDTAPGTTTLACRPAGHFADAATACASLAVGDGCTLAAGREQASGTCAADPNGAVVCVISCAGHEGPGGHDGHHHDGDGPGH